MAFINGQQHNVARERMARTADQQGARSAFQLNENDSSGLLVDEHGRLIVRAASNNLGYGLPLTSGLVTIPWSAGSAPQYDNVGLVETHRVMPSGTNSGKPAGSLPSAVPYIGRSFGYVAAAGWVQYILRDESGGDNPPVGGEIPEISIAVPSVNLNWSFGDWPLITGGDPDLATYLAFSTTGPTYTPGGANLWFAFTGGV